jgi:glycosyltransferase involved in cell wall biosynthesis
MIIKNEEKFLPGCLKSVKEYVDEIIIVDTGSTDRSIEIARQYGSKVFEHPWENDFSLHRNQALSYAHGEWIFQIDADERLAPNCGPKLREQLKNASSDVSHFWCFIHNIQNGKLSSEFSTIRIFRNSIGIKYKNIIHEEPIVTQGRGEMIDLTILHIGYDLSENDMIQKYHRNASLLKEMLYERPEDPFSLYHLSIISFQYDPHQCIKYAKMLIEILKKLKEVPLFYMNTYYTLAGAHMNFGELDEAEAVCHQAIKILPGYVDAYWILTDVAFRRQDFIRTLVHGSNYLERLSYYLEHRQHFQGIVLYSIEQSQKIQLVMLISNLFLGRRKAARHVLDSLLSQTITAGEVADAVFRMISQIKISWNTLQEILNLFLEVIPHEQLIHKRMELICNNITDSSTEDSHKLLEDFLKKIRSYPKLWPEIAINFYRQDRSDLLETLVEAWPTNDLLSNCLYIKHYVQNEEIELATDKINSMLLELGQITNGRQNGISELHRLIGTLKKVVEEVKGEDLAASLLNESSFLTRPCRETILPLFDSLVSLKALFHIKKYLKWGLGLNLIEQNDVTILQESIKQIFPEYPRA